MWGRGDWEGVWEIKSLQLQQRPHRLFPPGAKVAAISPRTAQEASSGWLIRERWPVEAHSGAEKPTFSPVVRKSVLSSVAALGDLGALGDPAAPSQEKVSLLTPFL